MRHPVPPIREDEAALKERLQHEYDGRKKLRLQMLDLLATRQAQDRGGGELPPRNQGVGLRARGEY
jgi:hypothetical protein